MCQLSDLRLGQAGIHHRETCTAVACRLLSGPVVAQVVEVDAEQDRSAASFGDRHQGVHQRGLAPEAPVAGVGDVVRVVQLAGVHADPLHAPVGRKASTVLQFAVGEGLRPGGDRQHPVRPQSRQRRMGQQ